jgi:hypothetical protein
MYAYLEDNHTSVVGMREYLLKNRSFASNYHDDITAERVHCISKLAMEKLMNPPTIPPTSNLTIKYACMGNYAKIIYSRSIFF